MFQKIQLEVKWKILILKRTRRVMSWTLESKSRDSFSCVCINVEIETSRDAEGSITNPVEESEGGGDIQGDGDRTLGDADSSCCEDIEPRTAEVYL